MSRTSSSTERAQKQAVSPLVPTMHSTMDPDRQKRREEIQKAMSFIQSSLPFPEPESYEAFMAQLVCNLLDEGNCCFRDGDSRQAAQQYGEGISVARYAQAEALVIPNELLESLYVNRAAACYQTREYERGVQDCDSALCVSEGSRRALYRKAICLRELGRIREAYECGTKCLLTAPHDRQVSDLAQDLATKLGLKGRKAYVSPQTESTASDGENHGESNPPTGEVGAVVKKHTQNMMSSNGLESLAPLATPIPVSDDPSSPEGTPCSEMSESPSSQGLPPMPYSVPVSERMDECSVIKDELDSLLECIPKKVSESPVQGAIPTNLPNTATGLRPPYSPSLPAPSPQLPSAFFSSSLSETTPLEPFTQLAQRDQGSTQAQDALGSFPTGETDADGNVGVSAGGLDSLSEYTLPGGRVCHSFIPGVRNNSANGPAGTNLSLLSRNPLAATHEFRQACHACYSRIGPRVMDYKYQPEAAHRCKRDVLLCRLKNTDDPTWKRIRPRPARNNFLGAFVLCKEVQERQECQYGENCTFAYCQEEIDVWTQERKGALSRELLFDPLGSTERRALSVTRLLQLHMGIKENLAVCSNLTARHPFDDNKCLVHVVRSANVRYSKVRPLHPLCQFDVCRHEVRYGCQREDSCSFAHSVIELKCWVLQQDTGGLGGMGGGGDGMGGGGVGPVGGLGVGGLGAGGGRGRPLNLKMKFVCGHWTKERRVLLVKSFEKKKWVVVRPLPFSRTYPQQYDVNVCARDEAEEVPLHRELLVRSQSGGEDVWTYMKNNSCRNLPESMHLELRYRLNHVIFSFFLTSTVRDMQQMYELWLQLTNQSRRSDISTVTPSPEDKQVTITADYTESM
ncbi:hypothetical protein F7725_013965, partial [Dissostichus mawsoni]